MRRFDLLTPFVIAGFVFLYAPIFSVVFFSFNDSRLATVWAGFSVRWYAELFKDKQILSAAWLSVKVALIAASLSVGLGTAAAVAFVRFGRFRLRTWLGAMIAAPLVMPDIVIGISLLLLFIGLEGLTGWPSQRGFLTLIIAHTTFGMAFAALIIEARLAGLSRDCERAAADLGAKPLRIFFDVTMPAIKPALIAAWLLAFTLSLDDVIIASFVSGPGASTLPVVVFSKVKLGVNPEINALATIMIAIVTLGAASATWGLLKRERKAPPPA